MNSEKRFLFIPLLCFLTVFLFFALHRDIAAAAASAKSL